MRIVAAKKILKANDQLAADNRERFGRSGVFCVNLVGSPGSGKTTLLEALFRHLGAGEKTASGSEAYKAAVGGAGGGEVPVTVSSPRRLRAAVIEGDIAGSIDAERIEALGVPAVQINTEGACHLDATMIGSAVRELDLGAVDLLVIENVGNLVCTAGFDLGEHLRVAVLGVSEGDDKAVKYPAIFQGSQALCVTKTDLLPHVNFSLPRIKADVQRLAPAAPVFEVSALKGDGIPALAEWLLGKIEERRGKP